MLMFRLCFLYYTIVKSSVFVFIQPVLVVVSDDDVLIYPDMISSVFIFRCEFYVSEFAMFFCV